MFTPDAGFEGTASFEYVVIADGEVSNAATVSIEVVAIASPPPEEPESEEEEEEIELIPHDILTPDEIDGIPSTLESRLDSSDSTADDKAIEFKATENFKVVAEINSEPESASYVSTENYAPVDLHVLIASSTPNQKSSLSTFDPILATLFWEDLESSEQEYIANFEFNVPTFAVVSTGLLTLSYLAWALNGGLFLTSFVSTFSGHINPLPLIEAAGGKGRREDKTTVEQLVDVNG